jgi:hypothetical protein
LTDHSRSLAFISTLDIYKQLGSSPSHPQIRSVNSYLSFMPSSPLLTINPTSLFAMPSIDPSPTLNTSRLSTRPLHPSSSTSTSTKRRRQDTATDPDPSPSTGTGPIRNTRRDKDGPKKKKAARACIHCQRAHLTCDDCTSRLTLVSHPFSSPSIT